MCYIFRSYTLLEEALNQHYHTLTMNGYLNESNFMMVEEGFSTRDLLEDVLVELCQAVRAGGSRHPWAEVAMGRRPLLTPAFS